MPEMHLRFTCSTCRLFTKNKERIQKFKEVQEIFIKRVCFQYDMAYGDFKELSKRTASVKILCNKAFNIAKNPKYYGYQRYLASVVDKFLTKILMAVLLHVQGKNLRYADKPAIRSKIMLNQQLVEDLHEPIIKKFERRKVYSSFKENILGADLVDMQLQVTTNMTTPA